MRKKKILMVGVMDKEYSTNVAMGKAWEALGYEVIPYNYRTVLAEKFGNHLKMAQDLLEFVERADPDLVILNKTDTLDPSAVAVIASKYDTWYWFMDPLATAMNFPCFELARNATFASATSSQVAEKFKQVNPNSHHIIEGVDIDRRKDLRLKKEYDVVFIGNADRHRIDFLRKMQTPVRVYGSGWPIDLCAYSPIHLDEWTEVVNKSKIVLNISRDPYIFSDRVINVMACGTLCLTEWAKDIDTFLGGLVRVAKTPKEMDELCDFFLHAEELRESVASFTGRHVRSHYSWEKICEQIMRKVQDAS